MKEIKFRQPVFLHSEFVKWHYWGFLNESTFVGPIPPLHSAKEQSQLLSEFHDKNNKEIYEGDIILCTNDFEYVVSGLKNKERTGHKIVFQDGAFWTIPIEIDETRGALLRNVSKEFFGEDESASYLEDLEPCEVIGDIYNITKLKDTYPEIYKELIPCN